jgi:hypothetical protein
MSTRPLTVDRARLSRHPSPAHVGDGSLPVFLCPRILVIHDSYRIFEMELTRLGWGVISDGHGKCLPGSSNSSSILNPITSAPKRILSSLMPKAKFFGGDPADTACGSSGSLQGKLQCGQAAGISRISSGETVSRDLH